MLGIYRVAAQLVASPVVLSSTELVNGLIQFGRSATEAFKLYFDQSIINTIVNRN
jgi:hypothetical protein